MKRFRALQTHIQGMPENEVNVIMDTRMVGTLALLSLFFAPPNSPSTSHQKSDEGLIEAGEEQEIEGRGGKKHDDKVNEKIKIKMNKWCWVFLGAWTVGEAGRVLKTRRGLSAPDHKVST